MSSVEPERAPEPPEPVASPAIFTASVAPLERMLILQVCQIYNPEDVTVCVQGKVKLHGQASVWVDLFCVLLWQAPVDWDVPISALPVFSFSLSLLLCLSHNAG